MAGTIVGLCGALAPGSRLLAAVEAATAIAADPDPATVVDFSRIETAVRRARYRSELDRATLDLLRTVESADVIVLGIPLGGGTMGGLFKHLLDLADREALAGKPVLALADASDLDAAPMGRLHARLVLDAFGLTPVREIVAVSRHAVSLSGAVTEALRNELSAAMAAFVAAPDRPVDGDIVAFLPRSQRHGARR